MELKELNKNTDKVPFLWIVSNIKLPKNAKWSFARRRWQIPIINDLSKNIVVIKPAQVGLSTIMSAKMLWTGYHVPMRIAYTLPREKDLNDLVPTRFNPMIDNSEILQEVSGKVDSVRRKQIGDTYIHFLEASIEPRMLDIDMLINDEIDLSDQNVLDQFKARLYASPYKIRYQLGTPSIPNYGISDLIRNSDWKIWHVKCPYCEKWVPFDEDWLGLLKVTKHRIYYGANCCDKCKDIGFSPEDISAGQWIAQNPSHPVSGYQIVRTVDATMSAQDLYLTWKDTRNERNFYNFALGLPYVAGGLNLSKEQVLSNCVETDLERIEYGERDETYYIGLDQGNVLHVVVLKEGEGEELELVYADVLEDRSGNPFRMADKILSNFPKNYTVFDLLPNRHSALEIIRRRKNTWGATFQGRIKTSDRFFEQSKTDENLVSIQKNDALDYLIENYIQKGKLRFYTNKGESDRTVGEVAQHLANLQRTTKSRKLFSVGSQTIAVWESSGPDHFAMALVYALTAYNLRKSGSNRDLLWAFIG